MMSENIISKKFIKSWNQMIQDFNTWMEDEGNSLCQDKNSMFLAFLAGHYSAMRSNNKRLEKTIKLLSHE